MELSARDKRILADIECESALDDPRWTRRFERLARGGDGRRHGRRRVGVGVLLVSALAVWTAAVVVGAVLLRPLLWAALAGFAAGAGAVLLRRRRVYGYWYRPHRRIPRIPEQNPPGRADGSES
jgi:Flp pilus assembly protein TadB